MKRRVALMGIVHESNTFVETQTDIRRFEEGHWCFGNDIITDYRHAYHEVGGMIQAMDEARLARWAERMFGDHGTQLIASTPAPSTYERYVAMQTLRAFREPTARLLDAQSRFAPVFHYRFDWCSPAAGGAFGSCHAIELGFVFGSYSLKGPDNFFGTGETADAINLAMMAAWTSFARSGQPTVGQTPWPARMRSEDGLLVFGGADRAVASEPCDRNAAWAGLPDTRVGA